MLININRKIFKSLPDDLKVDYIEECIPLELVERIEFNTSTILKGIISLINKNEKIIEKYGWESYTKEDFPAYDECSGWRHTTGRYAVAFFDISAETEDDLNYNFQVFEVI